LKKFFDKTFYLTLLLATRLTMEMGENSKMFSRYSLARHQGFNRKGYFAAGTARRTQYKLRIGSILRFSWTPER